VNLDLEAGAASQGHARRLAKDAHMAGQGVGTAAGEGQRSGRPLLLARLARSLAQPAWAAWRLASDACAAGQEPRAAGQGLHGG
jgi:hypothetical protein